MIYIFLCWAQPFWIQNQNIDNFIILVFEYHWLSPNPKTFRFGISGRSNLKPVFLVQKDGIEEKWFSGSIETSNRDDG